MKSSKDLLFFVIVSATLFLDQLTKIVIRRTLQIGESISVFPGFNIVHVTNTGAGFSILQGQNLLLIWLSVIVIGILLFFYDKMQNHEKPFYALMLGGVLGNLVDRISFGYVIDFLDVYVKTYHWPSFNIADSALSVGVIGLIIYTAYRERKANKDNL